jgi:3-oxo-5-alpha-steroid 4-dehydrogenase 1
MLFNLYNLILIPWFILAVISFLFLFKIDAPYGKFYDKNARFLINSKLGWFIQEIISPLVLFYFFVIGTGEKTFLHWFLISIWIIHYINRSIICPLRINKSSKVSLFIIFLAIFFNVINGFINGFYMGNLASFSNNYIYNLNFIFGITLFIIGVLINIIADNILIKIKNEGKGYQIPKGKLYDFISCPNYLGEMIEWTGFAIMCWSIPSLLFSIWTIANLFPRAISQHKWYNKTFKDNYPIKRKAILPYIL